MPPSFRLVASIIGRATTSSEVASTSTTRMRFVDSGGLVRQLGLLR